MTSVLNRRPTESQKALYPSISSDSRFHGNGLNTGNDKVNLLFNLVLLYQKGEIHKNVICHADLYDCKNTELWRLSRD